MERVINFVFLKVSTLIKNAYSLLLKIVKFPFAPTKSDSTNFTHENFIKTYLTQDFSFPDSIIYFITKNPSTAEVYQKLIKSCKHFFVKNPILVFHTLDFTEFEDVFKPAKVDLKAKSKIWITDTLQFVYEHPQSITSCIFSKIYKSSILTLLLCNQEITFNEFLFISSELLSCILNRAVIKDENGKNVLIEKFIEYRPNIIWFTYCCHRNVENVISKTPEEIFKVIHFPKTIAQIRDIPESFDIQTFFKNFKKNKAFISLEFAENCSENFQNQLETIIDEILGIQTFNYIPPLILFPELNAEKKKGMLDLCFKKWMPYEPDLVEIVEKNTRATTP